MAGDNSSPTISLRERSFPLAGAEERLPKWVTFSLIIHVGLALLIIISPFTSAPRVPTTPTYTVDWSAASALAAPPLEPSYALRRKMK